MRWRMRKLFNLYETQDKKNKIKQFLLFMSSNNQPQPNANIFMLQQLFAGMLGGAAAATTPSSATTTRSKPDWGQFFAQTHAAIANQADQQTKQLVDDDEQFADYVKTFVFPFNLASFENTSSQMVSNVLYIAYNAHKIADRMLFMEWFMKIKSFLCNYEHGMKFKNIGHHLQSTVDNTDVVAIGNILVAVSDFYLKDTSRAARINSFLYSLVTKMALYFLANRTA